MPNISDARILIIATDGFEDSELLDPRQTLIDRGARVTLASLDTQEITGDRGKAIRPDCAIDAVDSKQFDALLLPGGTKNPDKLRMEEQVVYMVKKFVDAGKPVGAICHGPWLMAAADVIRGRTVTSRPDRNGDVRGRTGSET